MLKTLLARELLNSIELGLASVVPRQGALTRALVGIAGSEVGIGQVREPLGGLLDALRCLQSVDRLWRTLRPQ